MYPDDTIFYIYTWCTGYVLSFVKQSRADLNTRYEEALKAIAMVFGVKVRSFSPSRYHPELTLQQIHVDRWRFLNYQNVIDDPVLQSLCAADDAATRFHSCERRNQCVALQGAFEPGSGKRVVSVEFVEEKAVEHAVKMKEVRRECAVAMQGKGRWPVKLVSWCSAPQFRV